MDTVTAPDGTLIAYARSGAGPPLVLVHGSLGDSTRWAPVLPWLEQNFSVYAVDRRGRGGSGDGPTYAIAREFEDIARVVDAIGELANLVGHSFGANVALEAALLTENVRKLVLYEPAMRGVPPIPEGFIDRLEALLDADDREGVLTTFLREVIRMPPDEIERFRASPAWPGRVAAAHTLPRELRATEHYEFEPQRFKDMNIPTLLLTGGDSPPFGRAVTKAAHAALPGSRIAVMPGQQHLAIDTAPDLFVHEVLTFLIEAS